MGLELDPQASSRDAPLAPHAPVSLHYAGQFALKCFKWNIWRLIKMHFTFTSCRCVAIMASALTISWPHSLCSRLGRLQRLQHATTAWMAVAHCCCCYCCCMDFECCSESTRKILHPRAAAIMYIYISRRKRRPPTMPSGLVANLCRPTARNAKSLPLAGNGAINTRTPKMPHPSNGQRPRSCPRPCGLTRFLIWVQKTLP